MLEAKPMYSQHNKKTSNSCGFALVCFQTDVEKAVTRWGKKSKLVLVSVLLAGLLLAALLTAGYYLKTHRKNSKGVRLVSL